MSSNFLKFETAWENVERELADAIEDVENSTKKQYRDGEVLYMLKWLQSSIQGAGVYGAAEELAAAERDAEENAADLERNAWDVVMTALPRDLDYGHALELRGLILNWNREHRFLPTEPGL